MNHAIDVAAVTKIRNRQSNGRAYHDKKIADRRSGTGTATAFNGPSPARPLSRRPGWESAFVPGYGGADYATIAAPPDEDWHDDYHADHRNQTRGLGYETARRL